MTTFRIWSPTGRLPFNPTQSVGALGKSSYSSDFWLISWPDACAQMASRTAVVHGERVLQSVRSPVRAKCCRATFVPWHIYTLAETRGQTYNKEFLSLSLVSNRLNLQRIPLSVNNQILYDNRSLFKIVSLVPIWTIKRTQESPVRAQIPSPGFLFTLKTSLKKKKNPMTQYEILSGHLVNGVTALSSRVKSDVVLCLSRGAPGESLETLLETLPFGPENVATSKLSSPWIPSSSTGLTDTSSTNECPFWPLPMVIKKHWKTIRFLAILFTTFQGQ